MGPHPVAEPPICVLGLSRSGTSLATRIIGLLGVDLGPEERMWPDRRANPTGYWEQTAIIELNDAILTRFGGTWWQPPEMPPGWERDEAMDPLKERARRLIGEHYETGRRWAWKDPRTCLTLPFWREVVGDLAFIACFRNPVDVADSLHAQSAYYHDWDASIALWLRFGATILAQTHGSPRLLVFHEDWLDRTEWQLDRVAEFVAPIAARPVGWKEDARRFIDRDLNHHRTSAAELAVDDRVPFETRLFYLALRLHTTPDAPTDLQALLPELDTVHTERHRGLLRSMQTSLSWWITARLRAAVRAAQTLSPLRRGGARRK